MKQAKRMTTQQQRAWILARGLQDQAGHDLGITGVRVVSIAQKHADGSIMLWPINEFPGPLDGKPRCNHHCEFLVDGVWVNAHEFIQALPNLKI